MNLMDFLSDDAKRACQQKRAPGGKLLDQWRDHCFVAKDLSGKVRAWRACPRCGGRGVMPRFGHIHRGICFKCEGAKIVPLPKAAERVVLRAVGHPA